MEPPNGHPCPECGAPRQRDNTPACACTHRAAEALHDARTAQAAAAEDFDPLRIRPYVEIDPTTKAPPAPLPGDATGPAGSAARPAGPADVTLPMRPVETDATADVTLPMRPVETDATAVLPAAPPTSVAPTPPAPAATEPSVTDLRLFDGTARARRGAPDGSGPGAPRSGRRRRTLLLATAGACVAVVAAAGYASGLFSYESPSRDTALPDDIRASVPDAPSSSAASTPPPGSASAAPPAPAAPRPSPSRTGSPSVSPSPSAPSASASPSRSPSPSASQPSATATGAEQASPDNSRQKGGPTVLRLGDRGPEVTELQLRLRQLYMYDDDTDGTFDDRLQEAVRTYQWSRGIQSDDLGVYDRETRAELESETREP
ncbi:MULTISPECIES: peptidoglycan-binding domain-containing protein [Streptomyces]|uniref:peptidoglycan-binding domain-containing protein n=1 Tax=Streptomyces TaxID=1883 RepID=UPI001F1022B0|nr:MULTISPECIES: peptidoglycan-binding domain-containing protein [Streptomyces]